MAPQKTKRRPRTRTYKIVGNGSHVFEADVSPTHVKVFKMDYDPKTDKIYRGKIVLDTSFNRIFIGDNTLPDRMVTPKGIFPGNTLLLETSRGQYIYIGHEIYSFQTRDNEPIVEYHSPVGNSRTPYAYGMAPEYIYFFVEKATAPTELFDLTKDAYGQFYGFTVDPDTDKQIKKGSKALRVKMIQKRPF